MCSKVVERWTFTAIINVMLELEFVPDLLRIINSKLILLLRCSPRLEVRCAHQLVSEHPCLHNLDHDYCTHFQMFTLSWNNWHFQVLLTISRFTNSLICSSCRPTVFSRWESDIVQWSSCSCSSHGRNSPKENFIIPIPINLLIKWPWSASFWVYLATRMTLAWN